MEDPTRQKLLRLMAEPQLAKSNTLKPLANLAKPYADTAEPQRAKLRTDKPLPKCAKSRTDKELPTRSNP
jgi:hypothetical protein